jgi:two-component system, sensor histidine kinase and response regulator
MPKATLLVVEDEPNLLLGIRDILELDDYQVMTAHDGREALQVLENADEHIPDLIVSDIMMPHLNGLEFLQEVRKKEDWVRIPFIFLTAKGSKQDVQQGKMLGVDDYLIKPFDADDLLVAVDSRLKRHRALNEVQEGVISNVKRNILTILNHEFRTPLTLVVAYADMLKEGNVEGMSETELLMFLREINNGANRLRRLIENFILLVELETGDAQKTFEWRKTRIEDLPRLIEVAVKQQEENPKVNHMMTIDAPENLPAIMGDREYLMAILTELLSNAIKFSPEDKPIEIGLKAADDNDTLKLTVRDHGRGIPPDQMAIIWESFYQVNRDQYEDQGAGSGLAIVKGLADMHDAQFDIDSTPGEGTCFTLTLKTEA